MDVPTRELVGDDRLPFPERWNFKRKFPPPPPPSNLIKILIPLYKLLAATPEVFGEILDLREWVALINSSSDQRNWKFLSKKLG